MGSNSSIGNKVDVSDKGIVKIPNEKKIENRGETILQAYQRLDKEICFLESLCPGPRIVTVEAWIHHLQNEIEIITEDDIPLQNNEKLTENEEIIKLALRLGILTDESKAESEEEFFAILNRSDIKKLTIHFYKEIISHTQSRMNHLIIIYNKLSALYAEQDNLIAQINYGMYSTELEEILDIQLHSERDIRDKLGNVVEQWRISAFLLKTSSKFAQKALKIWNDIENTVLVMKRLNLTLECRNCILASLTTVECSQLVLSQVDIKYISTRQISAIKHITLYLLTDVINKTRSAHIKKVLIAYQQNLINAISWLFQTFESSLKKDFKESEQKLNTIVNSLRDLRVKTFTKIVGNKLYVPKNFKEI